MSKVIYTISEVTVPSLLSCSPEGDCPTIFTFLVYIQGENIIQTVYKTGQVRLWHFEILEIVLECCLFHHNKD